MVYQVGMGGGEGAALAAVRSEDEAAVLTSLIQELNINYATDLSLNCSVGRPAADNLTDGKAEEDKGVPIIVVGGKPCGSTCSHLGGGRTSCNQLQYPRVETIRGSCGAASQAGH